MPVSADVLLVTVTKVESRAVLDVFHEATRQKAKPVDLDGRIYFDLGTINGVPIFLTQSEMGAGGLDSSLQAVQKGIDALSPAAVIMVGIAFGIDETWQNIGDILVAENLRPYELQRVGASGNSLWTDRPHVSPSLLNRLRSADTLWEGARVHFGVVLTGEKLVDNLAFRTQLKAFEKDAIGGEMEGAGLYAACQGKKIDWILVKAICDWADGNKAEDRTARQQMAAGNAAKFVLHALQFTPFVRPGAKPPLSVPETTSQSSLPTQPFFFGRDKELAIIAEAIRPDSRTWGVLIDGPGGMGKTALAVRAAHLAAPEHYPRKIFLSAKIRDLKPGGEIQLEDFMLPNYLVLLSELALELGDKDLAKVPENERANSVRRALTGQRALIVIDNVETFPDKERLRLYQFLSLLPHGCKAIVTSRRRTDVDARVIRLERLERKDALDLLDELAKTNTLLRAGAADWESLYGMTGGNPLLLRWTAGQLGRRGSQCRTVADACEFLANAPPDNNPLEYIFGDLLGSFTPGETAVLAALTHFSLPARVKWIADIAGLPERQAETALEDLVDRSLLVGDPGLRTFFLPPLTARFLRGKRPEAVAQTGDRLADRAYALVLENGYDNHSRYPVLEAEWTVVAAALPRLTEGDNARLQELCRALTSFFDFSGRWDDWLRLEQQAEKRALASGDPLNAGWRAFQAGYIYALRGQPGDALAQAAVAQGHWQAAQAGAFEQACAVRLRALGHRLNKNYPAALADSRQAVDLFRGLDPESPDVATALNDVGIVERMSGDWDAAERYYREALRITNNSPEGIAISTGNLAELALDRNDAPAAERLAREALEQGELMGKKESIGANCHRLAQALARQGRCAEGLPYARRAVEIFARLPKPDDVADAQAALKACEAGVKRL